MPGFTVKDARLESTNGTAVSLQASPNHSGALSAKYLVIHYTAGRSADESIAWLCSPEAQASAHLVIGRDGRVTQLVDFDKIAWHAGKSSWAGLTGLNQYSIGIELDNAGRLEKVSNGWQAWFGRIYPDAEVVVARHKNEDQPAGWHIYTEAQLNTLVDVAAALHAEYKFADILGHDDIAPQRKQDPGPAFPMNNFRSKILGRADNG